MRRSLYPLYEAELMAIEKRIRAKIFSETHCLIHPNDLSRLIDHIRDEWDAPSDPHGFEARCHELAKELDAALSDNKDDRPVVMS